MDMTETPVEVTSFQVATRTGIKRHLSKARSGRGRKQSAWATALYKDLLDDFERLRKAGVKFNATLLRRLALRLITGSTSDAYYAHMTAPGTDQYISSYVTPRWVQHFMQRNGIVSRAQTGKLLVSPAKLEQIEREVAFHLGQVSREFRSGSLKEEDVFNADETHFVINMDNHKTLALKGDEHVKYADVVSCDVGITMMVRWQGRNCLSSLLDFSK